MSLPHIPGGAPGPVDRQAATQALRSALASLAQRSQFYHLCFEDLYGLSAYQIAELAELVEQVRRAHLAYIAAPD